MIRIADSHSDFLGYRALKSCDGRLFDQADLNTMVEGGVALQVFAAWVPPEYPGRLASGIKQISYLYDFIKDSKDNMILCTAPESLSSPQSIKAVLSIESGDTLDCRTDLIQHVFSLGARMMSLTWNVENELACGCLCEGGLKPKGIEAVKELTKYRMALDLSHINEQGFWEAVELYKYSPCASHSCVYDLTPNPRNLRKDQIEHIIKSSGYIGVNFYTEFLRGLKASVNDIIRHIDYILSLGGQSTAGLGSDFCGIQYTPGGLNSVADFQKVPETMARWNYSDTLISQICYGNLEKYILKFL